MGSTSFRDTGLVSFRQPWVGGSWRHQVLMEDVGAVSSDAAEGPVCLSGERACAPEDCGVRGYRSTFEVVRNPRHDEYKHTKTCLGETLI